MEKQFGDLLIRNAVVSDAEQLCAWWNDGKVMEHAGFPNGLGTTVDEVREQLEDSTGIFIINYKDTPIGEMSCGVVDDDVCEMGIKICDFSMHNKGLGKIALSLMIDAVFNEYGFQKIILDTNVKNMRAQHVYEQLGFKKVRTNEDAWQDQLGIWQSTIDYELTKDTFISVI